MLWSAALAQQKQRKKWCEILSLQLSQDTPWPAPLRSSCWTHFLPLPPWTHKHLAFTASSSHCFQAPALHLLGPTRLVLVATHGSHTPARDKEQQQFTGHDVQLMPS